MEDTGKSHNGHPLNWLVLLLAVYSLATFFTNAYYMGDTWIYVGDIATHGLRATFYEFGHALWRPFGWLVSNALYPITKRWVGDDWRMNATAGVLILNWFAGLIATGLVYAVSLIVSKRAWVAFLVAIIFLFSNSILNYTQTGQPYVPGIALLMGGLYILIRAGKNTDSSLKTSAFAAVLLALGLSMWLPLLFAIPAILLSAPVLFGFDRNQTRLLIQTAIAFAVFVGVIYISMMLNAGVHDVASFKVWIGESGHGIQPDTFVRAVQRMIFGLSRNWVNMGEDGRLFKRWVVNDAFNPVSLSDLLRLSLWKMTVFYVFLISMVASLLTSKLGRKGLVLLIINGIPVVTFALFLFEAGSIDRYLPLVPMLVLSFGISLGEASSFRSWNVVITVIFAAVVIVANVSAMSAKVLNGKQEAVALRIRELEPMLTPQSRVITVNQQDEIYAFNQSFPFNPINRSGVLAADMLVDPGTTQIAKWQQIFASKTLAKWETGSDVWITKRVMSPRPQSNWNWVEGDDPNISWTHIYKFFSNLELVRSVGGDDGFLLVSPSPANKQFLSDAAQNKQQTARLNDSNSISHSFSY